MSSADSIAQITANWTAFFNPATPVSKKVELLQNGSAFASAISTLVANPLAAQIGAKVDSVTLTSATQATVKWDITGKGGAALLPNQTGTAILQGGEWKLGYASLCQLLSLEGPKYVPAACNAK
jgi:hypothetical protein